MNAPVLPFDPNRPRKPRRTSKTSAPIAPRAELLRTLGLRLADVGAFADEHGLSDWALFLRTLGLVAYQDQPTDDQVFEMYRGSVGSRRKAGGR